MHFTTVVTTIAAFAMGVTATPPPNSNVVSARIWPSKNCVEPNLGELTLHGSDNNKCRKLDDGHTIRSVKVYETADDCQLFVYSDSRCKSGKKAIADGQCRSSGGYFGSYKVVCK
ncbi:hypothetical protein FDECE_6048 [Fusarium decemcellulare]|uniref:Uncharacterized protein n=1 Tax=Fusarium decemcellulare TaxID=57161 RepID=A0ACC1SHE1_9HYPO|nr:hypothetical protein FDECE_6048 [Fusarium decemcellulare]KAJ3539768.1 hypothetical protein NM208_g5356 [Fusarium decemcellulare]